MLVNRIHSDDKVEKMQRDPEEQFGDANSYVMDLEKIKNIDDELETSTGRTFNTNQKLFMIQYNKHMNTNSI